MADELPYFKFRVSSWISGRITLEKMDVQGLFINICALYWQRSGELTLTEAKRRLSNAKPKAFHSLIENGLITVEKDFLTITFLDEQLEERQEKHEINRANGLLGGRPKKPKAFDSLTETKGNKIREEEKREEIENKQTAFGPPHSHFVVVKSKYLHEATARINGKAGLIEYMEHNQTVLNLPEHADKFMRANNGKVFNELSHLQNAYSLYIEKQYK